MRPIFPIKTARFALVFSFGLTSALFAQSGQKAAPRQAQPPAGNRAPTGQKQPVQNISGRSQGAQKTSANAGEKVDEKKVEEVDTMTPELEAILKKWELESSKIKSLHGIQSRSEFNPIFEQEKISKGPFFLETPDKGRIDMLAQKVKEGEVSRRKNKKGDSWALVSGESRKWICSGDSILMLDEDEKTFQRDEIPENQRGKNIVHSPLPFLFGMKAEEAKNRFKLQLVDNNDDQCKILAFPKMSMDRNNYRVARITLEKKRYLPLEVRLLDDNKFEIVYTFEQVVVNDNGFRTRMQKMFGLAGNDPYNPGTKGYKPIVRMEDPIAEKEREREIRQTRGGDPALEIKNSIRTGPGSGGQDRTGTQKSTTRPNNSSSKQ